MALGWEKFSVPIALSLLLALVVLALVANPMLNVAVVGILFALGAPITYTAYILVSSRVLNRLGGKMGSLYVVGTASLSFGICGLVKGSFILHGILRDGYGC